VTDVNFPDGYSLERLTREHPRKAFASGHSKVDVWLQNHALQAQSKRLSVTRVLLDRDAIAGYYTLTTSQVDFGELPPELIKTLPKRTLPVTLLAWLGVSGEYQSRGLGARLLARSLRDCLEAAEIVGTISVIADCVDDHSRSFFEHHDFSPLPGHPYRIFLSMDQVSEIFKSP
jgi:GNAT superfamily N-acetyltransferase